MKNQIDNYLCRDDIINCDKSRSKLSQNTEFHLHNSYEVYMLLDGDINYFVEQTCHHVRPGNVLIFNDREIHKSINRLESSHERIKLHFNPQYMEKFNTKTTNLFACFQNRNLGQNNLLLPDKEQTNKIYNHMEQVSHALRSEKYGSDLIAITNLIQILIFINQIYNNIFSEQDIINHKVGPILNYIDHHILEKLTLDQLSNAFSMDKYYLSHLFKQETGSTIFQYIVAKKVAIAKQLLSEGKNVTEACSMSGFNDYANFIRTFKKITGYSPGKYSRGY